MPCVACSACRASLDALKTCYTNGIKSGERCTYSTITAKVVHSVGIKTIGVAGLISADMHCAK